MDWVGPVSVPNVLVHLLDRLAPPLHFLFTRALKIPVTRLFLALPPFVGRVFVYFFV